MTALETTRHREEAARREQAARLEAEAANKAKDEFLAVVSHELRTPLGAILIWTQLLRQESVDEATVARALGIIERSTKSLAQLLDDLLDVSRIVSGKIRLEPRPVDLPSVLQVAVEAAQPAAEQKGLRPRRRCWSGRCRRCRATRAGCSRSWGTCSRTRSSSRRRAAASRSAWTARARRRASR